MKYTLQQRLERASQLKSEGYNCAQCVAMVFDDMVDFSADDLARISSALGGGVSGTRNICGALTGASLINGNLKFNSPKDKQLVYVDNRTILDKFGEINGSMICHELRSIGAKPCGGLISDAITLLHNHLA